MKKDSSKKNFEYTHVNVEEITKDIDEYIIPECQEACIELWARNIFTYMCSDRKDKNMKYIELGILSPQNIEIFQKLMHKQPVNYYFDEKLGTYRIRARGDAETVAKTLVELTKPFEMQDVLEGQVSVERFLMQRFGLKKEVTNPEYVPNLKIPDIEDFDDPKGFFEANKRFNYLSNLPKTIEEFDGTKMEKPLASYLEEAGVSDFYDTERKVIYESEFYKKAHLRYLDFLKRKDSKAEPEKRDNIDEEVR